MRVWEAFSWYSEGCFQEISLHSRSSRSQRAFTLSLIDMGFFIVSISSVELGYLLQGNALFTMLHIQFAIEQDCALVLEALEQTRSWYCSFNRQQRPSARVCCDGKHSAEQRNSEYRVPPRPGFWSVFWGRTSALFLISKAWTQEWAEWVVLIWWDKGMS